MSRLAGRFLGSPRRALPLCHVSPSAPDYLLDALFLLRCSAADYEHDLTFHPAREMPGSLLRRPPEDLFVELRELPTDRDRGIGRKVPERFPEPVRGLEEDEARRSGG